MQQPLFLSKNRGNYMASKTNCIKNGVPYYRIRRKVGKKLNKNGVWVDDNKDFYGKNKSDAERKFEAYMTKREAGIVKDNQYFGIMADHFITNVFLPDINYSHGTKENYINAWNKYIKTSRIAGLPLDQIRSADLQAIYNTLDCTPGALKSINNLMKLFYKYVEHEGYGRNITATLTLPKKESKRSPKTDDLSDNNDIVIWEDEEVKKILAGSQNHPLRFLIILALNTGLRISELLAVRYDDIEGNTLHVRRQLQYKALYEDGKVSRHEFVFTQPKYNSIRDVPLNETILRELKTHTARHREDMLENGYRTEYLFTTSSGGYLDRKNVTRSLARLYKRIDVEAKGIHTYRHTFATKLCAMGVPIQTASVLLGHSSISVTQKYYVNVAHEERLEAVERLVSAFNS